ncbi:hypothetical protein KAJ27_02680 [bacterium]|nr:hypothetical protein [bacterium]
MDVLRAKKRLVSVLRNLRDQQNNYKMHTLAGQLLLALNRVNEAVQEFNISKALKPEYPKNYLFLSKIYKKKKEYDNLIKELLKVIPYVENQGRIYFELARAYYTKGELHQAKISIDKARHFRENDVDLFIWLDKINAGINNSSLSLK